VALSSAESCPLWLLGQFQATKPKCTLGKKKPAKAVLRGSRNEVAPGGHSAIQWPAPTWHLLLVVLPQRDQDIGWPWPSQVLPQPQGVWPREPKLLDSSICVTQRTQCSKLTSWSDGTGTTAQTGPQESLALSCQENAKKFGLRGVEGYC
jgi:hypothetical protein